MKQCCVRIRDRSIDFDSIDGQLKRCLNAPIQPPHSRNKARWGVGVTLRVEGNVSVLGNRRSAIRKALPLPAFSSINCIPRAPHEGIGWEGVCSCAWQRSPDLQQPAFDRASPPSHPTSFRWNRPSPESSAVHWGVFRSYLVLCLWNLEPDRGTQFTIESSIRGTKLCFVTFSTTKTQRRIIMLSYLSGFLLIFLAPVFLASPFAADITSSHYARHGEHEDHYSSTQASIDARTHTPYIHPLPLTTTPRSGPSTQ